MIIKLTRKNTKLTESGLDKVEKHRQEVLNEVNELPTDENGNTREYYENLNLPIPEELNDVVNYVERELDFEEEDYEEYESNFLCNFNHVQYADEAEDSAVIMYENQSVIVKETIEEIENKIKRK